MGTPDRIISHTTDFKAPTYFIQHEGQHGGQGHALVHMVHLEVQELIKANAGMTSAECTTKCDALFGLLESHDEAQTDDMCKHACECDVDHNCNHPVGQHPTGASA